MFVLLVSLSSKAQKTAGSLAVKYEAETGVAPLLKIIDQPGADSDKVNALIKISHIYWFAPRDKNNYLDSCEHFATRARNLSRSAHYTEGFNEASFMMCKVYIQKTDTIAQEKILQTVSGEERVRLLLAISEYHVFKFGADKNELNKAFPTIIQAIKLSDSVNSRYWHFQTLLLLGKYYFTKGDLIKGKMAVMQIINDCDKLKDYQNEAHYWSELGLYLPDTKQNYPDKLHFHEMAYNYYMKANNKKEAAYSLRDIAQLNSGYSKTDVAEKQMLQVISMLNSLNLPVTYTTYMTTALNYKDKGELGKALDYTIKAVNAAGPAEVKRIACDYVLADIYSELGQVDKSLYYYKETLDYYAAHNKAEMYILCYYVVHEMAAMGNLKGALTFLTNFEKAHPPVLSIHKQLIAAAYGNVYNALKNYVKAEKFYLKMISLEHATQLEGDNDIGRHNSIAGSEAYFNMGKFYVERKRYKDAGPYLEKALTVPPTSSVTRLRDIHLLLFKVDSAESNYLTAIRHFQINKKINDSVFNAARVKQINELQIGFETKQKVQTINILNSQSKAQTAELQKVNLQRNFTIAGTIIFLIVSALAYYGYFQKRQSNQQLQIKQAEINQQNTLLHNLLNDKDNLLAEKDWLLKEVHHRVKNNLQIVMSLLSTQSAYLENEAAVNAISDSRNRVQAISLIHQKLYSSSNVASIDMQSYVSDLVSYLRDGLNTMQRRIRFEQLVEPVKIDLAQAVPLGLIMNEAITNAIKYAFDESGGVVIAGLQFIGHENLLLTISDNGKGLPPDFDLKKSKSLGMEMMKALSKQLGGNFNVKNNSGVTIMIEFRVEKILPAIAETLID